jgi:excisionase family DNA binding protein
MKQRLEQLIGLLDALGREREWLVEAVRAASKSRDTARRPSEPAWPLLKTVSDVANLVGVSERTVYRAIAGGELQTFRAGGGQRGGHRITEEAVRSWLTRGSQAAAEPES